jgi:hypothetical protein
MRIFAAIVIVTLALTAWSVGSWSEPAAGQNPTPAPALRVIPLGPNGQPLPTPSPSPSNQVLVRFAGQLLDVERGFAFFTTGDGFKLDPNVRIVDATTKQPLAKPPGPRMFASASFDKATGKIVELDVSKTAIASSQEYAGREAYAEVQHFAVSQSQITPSTDVNPNAYKGPPITGRSVAVTFVVQIPPSTPLSDSVYITTDVSNWDPRAILMTRIDALHYRATTNFASGTVFHYKYTRGSFRTIEVGQNGLNDPPHTFQVNEADALRRDDVVYHWADETVGNGTQNIGPGSIPTPFNPSAVLNRPTPPSAFVPAPAKTLPPGFGGAPPGGARGGLGK